MTPAAFLLLAPQAMADFPYVECFPEGWQKVRAGSRAAKNNHYLEPPCPNVCPWGLINLGITGRSRS